MAMKTVLRSNDPCWCGSGRKYKRCHKLSDEPVRPGKVSPRRSVPASIPHPDYAEGGVPGTGSTAAIQKPDVIERTREAMWLVIRAVKPGHPISDIGKAIAGFVEPHRLAGHLDQLL